ncbi:hypothetical protein U737_07590 [Methylomonas sp. LW13]|uniref:hypothetical protein n=1 Tax=unclassified Methylomonas TaxID=2608980 RepID=UPI00051B2C62|nr:hypothetical protein [Methylomonas sp. LW13]PKD42012.1 hypothetical protein CWO84_00980 [Methylomonas sp. Kb3]QBC26776.1 hypothetical protein U737_07590 [Methylomonas sp. LW13]
MKFSRVATGYTRSKARRDNLQVVEIDGPNISWDSGKKVIVLSKQAVPDFAPSSTSTYNCDIEISLSEIAEMIKVVGDSLVKVTPNPPKISFPKLKSELVAPNSEAYSEK